MVINWLEPKGVVISQGNNCQEISIENKIINCDDGVGFNDVFTVDAAALAW